MLTAPKWLILWRPLLPYGYSYKAFCARPRWAVICNFWHPGTLMFRAERQSVRMSKITNDGLTRSDTKCFIAVTHEATVGVKGLKLWIWNLTWITWRWYALSRAPSCYLCLVTVIVVKAKLSLPPSTGPGGLSSSSATSTSASSSSSTLTSQLSSARSGATDRTISSRSFSSSTRGSRDSTARTSDCGRPLATTVTIGQDLAVTGAPPLPPRR